MRWIAPLVLALFAAAGSLRADTVTLKNGNVLEGRILEERPDGVLLEVPSGTLFLPRSSIAGLRRSARPTERLDRARRLLEAGDEEQALALLEDERDDPVLAARVRDLIAEVHARRFDRLLARGRLARARESLEAMERNGARSAEAARRRADYQRARKDVDEALAAARDHVTFRRWKEAALCLERALPADPAFTRERAARAAASWAEHGKAALETDPAAAREALDRALRYNPDLFPDLAGAWVEARAAAAAALVAAGRTAESRALLDDMRAAVPLSALRPGREPPAPAEPEGGDVRRFASRRFEILHDCGDDFARALADCAEFHLDRILAALGPGEDPGTLGPGPTPLVILPDAEALRGFHPPLPSAAAHTFVSKGPRGLERGVRLVQSPRLLLGAILPHEIGHLVFHAVTRDRAGIPLWIHEAFALRSEPPIRHAFMTWTVAEAIAQGKDPLGGTFLSGTAYPDEEIVLFYAASYSLAAFLESRRRSLVAAATSLRLPAEPDDVARALGFEAARALSEAWKTWALDAGEKGEGGRR